MDPESAPYPVQADKADVGEAPELIMEGLLHHPLRVVGAVARDQRQPRQAQGKSRRQAHSLVGQVDGNPDPGWRRAIEVLVHGHYFEDVVPARQSAVSGLRVAGLLPGGIGADQPVEVDPPPIWQGDGLWPHIVVYGTYWCQDTTRSRNYLSHHGIPYTFVDVEVDSDAAQRVMDWNEGYLSTPTLDIDGGVVTEPSDEELAEILGLVE